MALRANPFDAAFSMLQKELSELHYECLLAKGAEDLLSVHTKRTLDACAKMGLGGASKISGSALLGRHPRKSDGRIIIHGRTHASTADYAKARKRMIRSLNALILARGFEATEAFFRAAAGQYLYQARGIAVTSLPERSAFEKRHPKMRAKRGDRGYYNSYAQFVSRRNCNTVLKLFDRHVTSFGETARNYQGGIDLFEVFRTIGSCRHAVVHNRGILDECAVSDLEISFNWLLRRLLDEKAAAGDEAFLVQPDFIDTQLALRLLVDFCAHLYVALAELFQMKADLIVEPN